jgi:hypothetical protein
MCFECDGGGGRNSSSTRRQTCVNAVERYGLFIRQAGRTNVPNPFIPSSSEGSNGSVTRNIIRGTLCATHGRKAELLFNILEEFL